MRAVVIRAVDNVEVLDVPDTGMDRLVLPVMGPPMFARPQIEEATIPTMDLQQALYVRGTMHSPEDGDVPVFYPNGWLPDWAAQEYRKWQGRR